MKLAHHLTVLALIASVLSGLPAVADFSSESELTEAMDLDPADVDTVTFTGDTRGASVETAVLPGFPVTGSSYLLLSTGVASDITLPDDTGSHSTDLTGPTGAAGEDQTQLQIRLNRPSGATCFAFDFKFLSEEYPEFVGSQFNDAFTAEIVDSDLTFSNGTIVTPFNFAYDTEGNAISINTVFGMSDDTATTFDGSTPLLTATTPAELSDDQRVLITMTIQDVGDSIYDSAVAIDNARWLFNADCEAGATVGADADGDGLPDEWETGGLDVDGDEVVDVDLPAMGADPQHKDLFLEIDWMFDAPTCIWIFCWGGEDFSPTPAALEEVVAAFAEAPVDNPDGTPGITLHIDAGPSSVMDPTTGATWGAMSRGNPVDHVADLGENTTGSFTFVNCQGNTQSYTTAYSWGEFQGIKDNDFDDMRRDVFHYAIYADQYGGSGSSGISRGIPGGDLIVSQGAFNGGAGFTLIQERGTLMHEFGHNLALRHGGDDNCNREPNYLSIMSYSFQLVGLRAGSSDGLLDYSRAALDNLIESSLDEPVGLAPNADVGTLGTRWSCALGNQVINSAAGAIDWNCDGAADDTSASVDINGDGSRNTLTGHDDWSNLRFDGGGIGALGDEPQPEVSRDDELTRDLAEELGVLAGAFDALLIAPHEVVLLPETDERDIFLTVRNVGTAADSYDVELTGLPLAAGPADPTLEAGESAQLTTTVDTDTLSPGSYPVTVTVTSGGRGEEVAAASFDVIVPDMSDPEIAAAAEAALADLEDLEPGTGPDTEVLDQILDMLEEAVRPDPRPALEAARVALSDLDGDQHVDRAIHALDRSLVERSWIADDELIPNGGSGVFGQLIQAALAVGRADVDPGVGQDVLSAMAGAGEDLVDRKYELAEAAGVPTETLAEAAELIDEAETIADSGDVAKALELYQDAWDLLNDATS